MRVITILGPSQSGKSTLAAALAALEGGATTGAVSDALSMTGFDYLGDPWCAIDVPGGADCLSHAAQALAISDAAVLCVPPDPEAAVLSAPYLRLVEEAGAPCFLFINRMDAADGRVRDIVAALQAYSSHPILLRQVPMRADGKVIGAVDLISERAWRYREGEPSDLIEIPDSALPREQEARAELLESLSDYDDALLEQLIEDRRPPAAEIFDLATRIEQGNKVIPAFLGAASHANGVTRLMKSLRHEAATAEAAGDRLNLGPGDLAVGFVGDIRKHLGKVTLLRAFRPGIRAGAQVGGAALGSLTGIDGRTPVTELDVGRIAVAVKSDHLTPGRVYSADAQTELPGWSRGRPPSYRRILNPANERDGVRLSEALTRLAETVPGLSLEKDVYTGRPVIAAQGPMQARALVAKLQDDFGVEVEEEEVPSDYRETIGKAVERHYRHRKQSGGAGQFADVVMEVRPAGRGEGFTFEEVVKGGAVPRNYIPACGAGAEDALAAGPYGFPVVDVAVTLKDGKHHSVDSSDHAFRTAAKACIREALVEAGPLVLQPIERVDIHVPSIYSGHLVSTISGLKGHVLGFEAHAAAPGWDVFSALLPAAAREDLFRALGGATQGTAWAEIGFDHYEEVPAKEAERISAARAVEPA